MDRQCTACRTGICLLHLNRIHRRWEDGKWKNQDGGFLAQRNEMKGGRNGKEER